MSSLETLERYYKTFIDRTDTQSFFNGLAEYLDYALSVSTFKKVFDDYIRERAKRYQEIENLEKTALAETEYAKRVLLGIVGDNKVNTDTFQRFGTFPIPPFKNIIEELAAYENEEGGVRKGGFHSDNIQSYLFDIAANLQILGYGDKIKEFIVPAEDYGKYHQRVNNSAYPVISENKYGNFIFSKTLPDRWQAEALRDKEREFKLWGAFEALLNFKNAYDAIAKNGNFSSFLEERPRTLIEVDDDTNRAFMVDDIKIIIGETQDTVRHRFSHNDGEQPQQLRISIFKTYAQTVHNEILRRTPTGKTMAIDGLLGRTHRQREDNEIKGFLPTQTNEESGIGVFWINNRKIIIGPIANVPFKLLNALSPLGTQKSVEVAYKETTTTRSKHSKVFALSSTEKLEKLRMRTKDLQDIFNKQKGKPKIKIRLVHDKKNGTIYLRTK